MVLRNVVIRHFTGDPPAQARRATAYLKAAPAGELTLLDVHVGATPRRRASGLLWVLIAPTPSWVERPEFAASNPDRSPQAVGRDPDGNHTVRSASVGVSRAARIAG